MSRPDADAPLYVPVMDDCQGVAAEFGDWQRVDQLGRRTSAGIGLDNTVVAGGTEPDVAVERRRAGVPGVDSARSRDNLA